MALNVLPPPSLPIDCLVDVADLPGGLQHWSLSGTPLERKPETDVSSFVDRCPLSPIEAILERRNSGIFTGCLRDSRLERPRDSLPTLERSLPCACILRDRLPTLDDDTEICRGVCKRVWEMVRWQPCGKHVPSSSAHGFIRFL